MFYQHYPHSYIWKSMHWGHAVSKDLINWIHLPIFLRPDESISLTHEGHFSSSSKFFCQLSIMMEQEFRSWWYLFGFGNGNANWWKWSIFRQSFTCFLYRLVDRWNSISNGISTNICFKQWVSLILMYKYFVFSNLSTSIFSKDLAW